MTMTTIERAQQQVDSDRMRIGETTTELRQVLHDRVEQAKATADPRTYIRNYPWIALGLVFGAGIAVAMTGADRKAVHGAVDLTKDAGGALRDGAGDAKDFVVHKVKGDEPDPLIYADGGAEQPIERHTSVGGRIFGSVDDLLYRALQPVLDDMRGTIDGTRPSVAAGP